MIDCEKCLTHHAPDADHYTWTQTCTAAPFQVEGRFTGSDRPYYFRARGGRWYLLVGKPGWPTDVLEWPLGEGDRLEIAALDAGAYCWHNDDEELGEPELRRLLDSLVDLGWATPGR